MLSLGKILGLAVILFVIWQVFRFLETQKKIRESQSSGRGDGAEGAASVEMTECLIVGNGIKQPIRQSINVINPNPRHSRTGQNACHAT